jgi:integrase
MFRGLFRGKNLTRGVFDRTESDSSANPRCNLGDFHSLGSGALIRLEGDQTKNSEARTIPLPDAQVKMLNEATNKQGIVFDSTNLRKTWCKACVAAGLGTPTEVEGKADPRYTSLIVHDLRRSAIKNLMKAGVNEKVAMKISGHKTRDVFDRYHIVDTEDVGSAMRKVQSAPAAPSLVSEFGVSSTPTRREVAKQKLLTA